MNVDQSQQPLNAFIAYFETEIQRGSLRKQLASDLGKNSEKLINIVNSFPQKEELRGCGENLAKRIVCKLRIPRKAASIKALRLRRLLEAADIVNRPAERLIPSKSVGTLSELPVPLLQTISSYLDPQDRFLKTSLGTDYLLRHRPLQTDQEMNTLISKRLREGEGKWLMFEPDEIALIRNYLIKGKEKLIRIEGEATPKSLEMFFQALKIPKGRTFKLRLEGTNLTHLNFLRACPISKLVLIDNKNLTNFRGITSCPTLKNLYIFNCEHWSAPLWPPHLSISCNHLRELKIVNSVMSHVEWLRDFPNLRTLELMNIVSEDEQINYDGLKYCPKLKTLQIEFDIDFPTDIQELIELLNCHPHLTKLTINGYNGENLGWLSSCRELKELVLENYAIADISSELPQFTQLESLTLNSAHNDFFNPPSLPILPNIKTIKLYNIQNIEELLSQLKNFKNLKTLWIQSADITTLDWLCECPQIEELVLEKMWLAVDEAWSGLTLCAKSLRLLKLDDIEDISDLDFLTDEFQNLRTIVVKNCSTLQSLNGAERCPQLEKIEIKNCEELTNVAPASQCRALTELSIPYQLSVPLEQLDLFKSGQLIRR